MGVGRAAGTLTVAVTAAFVCAPYVCNQVLMMHAAEARSMEPSPHILTIGRCSLLNFKLLPAPRKYVHGGWFKIELCHFAH